MKREGLEWQRRLLDVPVHGQAVFNRRCDGKSLTAELIVREILNTDGITGKSIEQTSQVVSRG